MTSFRRLLFAAVLGMALAAFHFAPSLLGLGPDEAVILTIVATLGGPLMAAIFCFRAAWRSRGDDRVAWQLFGAGSVLYFAGNLCYIYYSLAGIETSFPALPEAAFFIMAGLFAAGMFKYGKVRERISRVQFYNFSLIFCALTLGVLFLLNDAIATSVLTPFGTLVAFLYPALWGSVAAFGAMSFLVYDQRRKAFPFSLLLLAIFAEAGADFAYALALLEGSYVVGGTTQLLWIASAALIAWAALEEPRSATSEARSTAEAQRLGRWRNVAQAGLPACAIAIILIPGALSGTLGNGFVGVALGLALSFALIVGFREFWVIQTQRQLRTDVEDSRTKLAASQKRLTSVLQSTSDSVIVLDRDWRIEFFNQQALRTLGISGELRLGAKLDATIPAFRGSRAERACADAMRNGHPVELEEYYEPGKSWLQVHAYPTAEGISIFFRDISEQRRVREEIFHMAHHDPLTGLANRTLFRQRLVEAAASGVPSATLLLDLDHFKEVNDSLGHPVGDRLLAATALRLRGCLREEDTIARLGGDEFAIILSGGPSREDVTAHAREILELAGAPHTMDGQSIKVGASLGIALSNGVAGDADQILRAADIALYAAKSESRGTFRFFDPVMEAGLLERQALRGALVGAIERGEFHIVYQPLVDLHTHQVASFEALLRWRHPVHGMVPPSVFIPVAEESGLIVAIGEWVLRTACAEAMKWPEQVSVAINLSPQQFADGEIAYAVQQAMASSGLPSQRLELEITESVLLDDNIANMATLHRLRGLGVRIALDDFGTGYSSLGYLQHFPFSKIKIDRSFISGLPGNEESQAIVKMIIGLGKSLGLKVTAEGVETEEQLAWVRRGCNEAQGYYLSRPVPATDIPGLIQSLNDPIRRKRVRAAAPGASAAA